MSTNSTTIYTGPWVNWSQGLVLGSTITVSSRNGAVLTSFIAAFIGIVGTQLWKILCFSFHQSRVSQAPQDGLYYQHQNVLRNSGSPGVAAWSFMLQSWHWSGHARHSLMRSLPWALLSTVYAVIFTVLAIFGSSEVAQAAGQDRLLRGSQCGYWTTSESNSGRSVATKVLVDSQIAATYSRNCYRATGDRLSCNTYATPKIKYEAKAAECPFQDGICWKNETYQMDTGLMDSHYDLGINTPASERLKYRRLTTCSVLNEAGYINESDTTLVTWNYGPLDLDYTFSYSTYTLQSPDTGYTVGVRYSYLGENSTWVPASALNRTDADVHLIYVASNSILYENPVDDPVFSAHLVSNASRTDAAGNAITDYSADYFVRVIACADQHQICHGNTCTPLSGAEPTFSSLPGATAVQESIFQRIGIAQRFTGITQVINGRSGSALRASETVIDVYQRPLPANQWQIEVSSWFTTGLAMLQHSLGEFVSPEILPPGTYVEEPLTAADKAMCFNQKTRVTNGTISFSILGLAIILIIGVLVILTSLVLDPVVGWIGVKSHMSWRLDDTLQLQRMVFEARGISWINTDGRVPVTQAGERFPGVAKSAESQPLMAKDEKVVGVNVREFR